MCENHYINLKQNKTTGWSNTVIDIHWQICCLSYLGCSKSTNWPRRAASETKFVIDPKLLVSFCQFKRWPNLDRFDLMRCLCLNSKSGQKLLKTNALSNRNQLNDKIIRRTLQNCHAISVKTRQPDKMSSTNFAHILHDSFCT